MPVGAQVVARRRQHDARPVYDASRCLVGAEVASEPLGDPLSNIRGHCEPTQLIRQRDAARPRTANAAIPWIGLSPRYGLAGPPDLLVATGAGLSRRLGLAPCERQRGIASGPIDLTADNWCDSLGEGVACRASAPAPLLRNRTCLLVLGRECRHAGPGLGATQFGWRDCSVCETPDSVRRMDRLRSILVGVPAPRESPWCTRHVIAPATESPAGVDTVSAL